MLSDNWINIFLKIKALKNSSLLSIADADIKSQVLINYQKAILAKLEDLFIQETDNASIARNFKTLLADNWNDVEHSMLSYTAHPQSDITILLSDIAVNVARFYQAQGDNDDGLTDPLKILMPTLTMNLSDIEESIVDKQKEQQIQIKINQLDLDKKGTQNQKKILEEEKKRLQLQHILKEKLTLPYIFKTHILSDSATMLLPIWEVLSDIESLEWNKNKFKRAYLDDDGLAFFTEGNEAARLLNHSNEIQYLVGVKETLSNLQKQSKDLYSQIQLLLSKLYFNSVDGVGAETLAGVGGAQAIADFFAYYDQVSDDDKAKLSQMLQLEISKLGQCIDHPKGSRQNLSEIETCLATRKNRLSHAIQGHAVALSMIAIDEATNNQLISNTIQTLQKSIAELLAMYTEGSYTDGVDHLPITLDLLNKYDIRIVFNDDNDVRNFLTYLTADEISLCFDNDDIVNSFINRLNERNENQSHFLENIVMIGHQYPLDKFSIVLANCIKLKSQDLMKNPNDLQSLLITFHDQDKFNIILTEVVKSNISLEYFCYATETLMPNQKNWILDFILQNDTFFINSFNELHLVFSFFGDQQDRIISAFKDKLPNLVKTSEALYHFFKLFKNNEYHQSIVIDHLDIGKIIDKPEMLMRILQCLNANNYIAFFEKITDLSNSIKNFDDLSLVLCQADKALHRLILQRLPIDIAGANDTSLMSMTDFLVWLDKDCHQLWFENREAQLFNLIKNEQLDSNQFKMLLSAIDQSFHQKIFDCFCDQFVAIIKSPEDLSNLLEGFDESYSAQIFEIVNKSSEDNKGLINLLANIDFLTFQRLMNAAKNIPDIQLVIFNALKRNIQMFIYQCYPDHNSLFEIITLLSIVHEKHQMSFFHQLQSEVFLLLQRIDHINEFSHFLNRLYEVKNNIADSLYNEMIEMIEIRANNIIDNINLSGIFFSTRNMPQHPLILNLIKNAYRESFKESITDPIILMKFLIQSPEFIYDVILDHVSDQSLYFENIDNLENLLLMLCKPDLRAKFFNKIKGGLASLITNDQDIRKIFDCGNQEVILDEIEPQLPRIISSYEGLVCILSEVGFRHHRLILNALSDKIPMLNLDIQQKEAILNCLHADDNAYFLTFCNESTALTSTMPLYEHTLANQNQQQQLEALNDIRRN